MTNCLSMLSFREIPCLMRSTLMNCNFPNKNKGRNGFNAKRSPQLCQKLRLWQYDVNMTTIHNIPVIYRAVCVILSTRSIRKQLWTNLEDQLYSKQDVACCRHLWGHLHTGTSSILLVSHNDYKRKTVVAPAHVQNCFVFFVLFCSIYFVFKLCCVSLYTICVGRLTWRNTAMSTWLHFQYMSRVGTTRVQNGEGGGWVGKVVKLFGLLAQILSWVILS